MINWIRTLRDKQARLEMNRRVRTLFKNIEVQPGSCRYNFRCHDNAIHEAVEHGWHEIALVVYIEKKYPVVHFLNVVPEKGYVDNTLGHNIKDMEFYLVKHIHKEEFDAIHYIHTGMRRELRRHLSFWNKLFSTYDG